MTPQGIGGWKRHHGFPAPEVRGLYDLRTVGQWLVKAWKDASRPASKADAKARLTQAQAEREELKLEEDREELIKRVLVQHSMDAAVVEARGILMNLSPLLLSAISPEGRYSKDEIEGIIGKQIDRALTALARGKDLGEES